MSLKPLNLSALQAENIINENEHSKIKLTELLYDKNTAYLNECSLFMLKYNEIPNYMSEHNINCIKANRWFIEAYKSLIKDVHFRKSYSKTRNETEFEEIHYCLYDDLIVSFNRLREVVRFLFRNTPINNVEDVIICLKKFKIRKEKNKPVINLLINSVTGFETQALPIIKPKLSLEDNYNDDFKLVHQTIFSRLSKNNNKGLVLLHGKPGTGKTSYIRYLIASLKKEIFFLPPNMAEGITDPSLISILIKNSNSIFVIEDAENIIVDRETHGGSAVSALLNISDGLLSDCLNIQIICSFNTDISKVDSALMRKGRLIAKYEFKELETAKAQSLSNKLKFDTKICKPMTLTEIYNQNDVSFQPTQQRTTIGFLANNN